MTATPRQFRVLRGQSRLPSVERDRWPATVPWSLVEPWREQAEENHGQTLERLNERGGLAPQEMWLAAHGFGLRSTDLKRITEREAGEWLIRIAAAGTKPSAALGPGKAGDSQ
jgi:hypothetical protein